MRTRHLALIALAVALLAPSAVQARWDPPQDMGLSLGSWAYDGNARGDRILVWQGVAGLVFAQARPAEPLGQWMPLGVPLNEPESPRQVHVEIDERGNALVLWRYFDGTEPEGQSSGRVPCCYGLRAVVVHADGTFTEPVTLAPKGNHVDPADMQIAPDGRFGIVFSRSAHDSGERSIDARFGTVKSGFGPLETVFADWPASPLGTAGPVALSFVGRRARVQYATGGQTDTYWAARPVSIRETERRGSGRWRRLANVLPTTNMIREYLRFATAPDGQQVASWVTDEELRGVRARRVVAGDRAPGRRFRVRTLAREDHFDPPVMSIEPSGNALVAWASRGRGIVDALRRPRAAFGSLNRIAQDAQFRELVGPRADVNRRGHALLAWAEQSVGGPVDPPRLVAAFRNSRGSALEHHAIDDVQFDWGYSVGLDRAGRGHLVYTNRDRRLLVVAGRIGG